MQGAAPTALAYLLQLLLEQPDVLQRASQARHRGKQIPRDLDAVAVPILRLQAAGAFKSA
jgi:hypothetical protein